ncbi:glycosyltransferase [Enterocloster bolteae]|uniref:glycosyltransferase n=1 Tax=Enterocloster bolteae TaxID=208479 RepID=UPI00189DFDBE|nr:glycosyltransferase [Enterocloster bolteae]
MMNGEDEAAVLQTDYLPLISVIIPIYKVEKYLCQCIKSVQNQTYWNLEIILVDDGSPDKCPQMCDDFFEIDRRIKVVHKENGGLVSARKAGIKIATGEYIAYVDGDDWIAPTLYMELYEKGLQYGVDIVSCSGYIKYYSDDFKQVIKNNLGNGLYYKEEFEKKVFPHLINTECFYNTEIPLSLWAHVFKRKLLYDNQMRIDNIIRMAEDLICVSFCFMDARYVALTDVCGYYYRLTLESMTQNHFEDEDERIERLYTQYIERIYELSYEKIFLKKLKFAMIYIFLISNYGRLMRSEDETLFPFSKVKKGNQIIVYGAGAFGKELVRFLKKDNRFNLVAWVDAAYKKYQEQGMNIRSPEEVLNIEFDYLVIAVTKEKIAKQICRDLANRGIDVTKVQEMDLQMINNMNNPLGI